MIHSIHIFLDLSLAPAKDRTVQEYVFPSCKFVMKARANFPQTSHTPTNFDLP